MGSGGTASGAQRVAGASSVENALRLIEELAERKSLRVAEAASILDVSSPTAYRLLSALLARDFVTKDHRRIYHAGPRLQGLGVGARPRSAEAAIFPFLAEISEVTGHSANFCILEGNGARSLVGVCSRSSRLNSRDGWLLPAHLTSAGHVLLAELSEQALQELYPLGVPKSSRCPDFDLRELRRRIATVRRRGWALNDELSERGIIGLAVPVRDPDTQGVLGAIALVASAMQTSTETVRSYAPLLLDCAQRFEAQFARFTIPAAQSAPTSRISAQTRAG
jgi:DNA-binding IclR family transcriptional regulator